MVAERDDDERVCATCADVWPDDDEFYRAGSAVCRACETETAERRRTAVREAARRLRLRRVHGPDAAPIRPWCNVRDERGRWTS